MATELNINGVLRPVNSADETHEDIYGKGGFVAVLTLVERDAIPSARRKEGMVVNVENDNTWYKLVGGITNSNWSTDIAANILSSGGSVTEMNDVSDAGAGIIPSLDSNTKLSNIPLSGSAGYRDDSFFVTYQEYIERDVYTPTVATSYNIIGTLAELNALPVDEPELIDVGTIVYVLEDNTTYQADSINVAVWNWVLFVPESDYLTDTDASATYLTQANATTTYLTQANATSTYLTQADATTTYLTKVDAATLYPTQIAGIPASSGASGTKGEYVFDTANGFRYDCIATDTWVQTAIVTTF